MQSCNYFHYPNLSGPLGREPTGEGISADPLASQDGYGRPCSSAHGSGTSLSGQSSSPNPSLSRARIHIARLNSSKNILKPSGLRPVPAEGIRQSLQPTTLLGREGTLAL